MPLKGVKVLELVGLAPGPFCGKILSDFGASVTRIDKVNDNIFDKLQHGKDTLALNLKLPAGQQLLRKLATNYDVLIEPFRPGVMEKLNLGPQILMTCNRRLIYARLTGFGQDGRLAKRAGHDLNYLAISGVLSMLGRANEKPCAPINLLADFAGGGLMCAFGILLALLDRHRTGHGQIVDAAMIDGAAYVASWLFMSRDTPGLWGKPRGHNLLDGGAYFYDTYKTKDGLYMSVAAIEPQFFDKLKHILNLPEDLTQFSDQDQVRGRKLLDELFRQKTQAEWSAMFEDKDACVYPVLNWQQVMQHDHNAKRASFKNENDVIIPTPAPRLSRTPGESRMGLKKNCRDIFDMLEDELQLKGQHLRDLIEQGVVLLPQDNAKL